MGIGDIMRYAAKMSGQALALTVMFMTLYFGWFIVATTIGALLQTISGCGGDVATPNGC